MQSHKDEIKRKLRGYILLSEEIKERGRELNDYLEEVYNPLQGVILDSQPRGGGRTSDQTARTVIEIEQTHKRIIDSMRRTIQRLELERIEIENAINSLPTRERCVLYYRYKIGIPTTELPEYTGHERSQNQRDEARAIELLSRKYERFFKS